MENLFPRLSEWLIAMIARQYTRIYHAWLWSIGVDSRDIIMVAKLEGESYLELRMIGINSGGKRIFNFISGS